MAPSVDITNSNDTASVAVVPTKTVESLKAANGTNDSTATEATETIENGTNGTNGASDANGSSDVNVSSEANGSTETNGSVENGTAVSETPIQEEIITSNISLATQEIQETSISTETVDRSFICSSHFRPARFPEVIGPLPFPKDLRKLVAWSDAFVTRLGWESLRAQENIEILSENLRVAVDAKVRVDTENLTLQQSLNVERDQVRSLTAENIQLKANIKTLEEQRIKDAETIRGYLQQVSDLKTENFTLDNLNDKLEAHNAELNKKCDEYIEELVKRGKNRKALVEGFARWYKEDAIRDRKREDLNLQLQSKLEEQEKLNTKTTKERDDALTKAQSLEAERDRLTIELEEAVKVVQADREEIAELMKRIAAGEGERAVLIAKLFDVTTREANSRGEIDSLRLQLDKARADFETAKKDVAAANEHSKKHWKTLESIRVDGDWALKNEGADPCEWTTIKPSCTFGADESRPILNAPVICALPTQESVMQQSAPADTSVEASA